MTLPRVSVVIPAHNRQFLVGPAIDSVLAQLGVEVELVVVDDGSSDGTREVLKSYGSRIKVLSHTPSRERGASRNLGALSSSGELIAFLDSDDLWEPGKLVRQLQAVRPGAAVVTGLRFIDASGHPTGSTYTPPPEAQSRLHLENGYLGSPSSLILERSTFMEVEGFPEDVQLQGSEDWLFLLRLKRAGKTVVVLRDPLVRYRVHQDNSTADPLGVSRSMWAACGYAEAEGLVSASQARRMRGRTAGVIARQFMAAGHRTESVSWLRRAAKEGSRSEWLRALPIVAGAAVKRSFRRTERPAV